MVFTVCCLFKFDFFLQQVKPECSMKTRGMKSLVQDIIMSRIKPEVSAECFSSCAVNSWRRVAITTIPQPQSKILDR